MNSNVDYQKLVPVNDMVGEDEDETTQLRALFQEAKDYLCEFPWCQTIRRGFYGIGIGGVLGVFLFEIDGNPAIDRALWVVCGDLPSAYLVTDEAPTPCAALRVYCKLMEDWVAAVRGNGRLEDAFPVAAEATESNASLLERRVSFLRNDVIPLFE